MAQDGLRQVFESIEQGPQFSILVRRGAKQGHHIASEFHIDGFALGLIRPLEVRPVAFGRVVTASALDLATLHHALEKRAFAEVLQLLKLLFESLKAFGVVIWDRRRGKSSRLAHNLSGRESILTVINTVGICQ